MTISERLRRRIAREGPISFEDFMEAALYDELDGYYAKGASIGEGGDFATSPTISPLFARTIARAFCREMEAFDAEIDFVEVGAGEGLFLEQLADWLSRDAADFASRVRLHAVERTRAGRAAISAREVLAGVEVHPAASDLSESSIHGWIFSNELYDALPVARLRATPGGLDELRVDAGPEGFRWTAVPVSERLAGHLAALGVTLAPGQTAEVCLGAAPLHRTLARALGRGSLVVVDYGHRARTLYHPTARFGGTLAVHSGGRRGGDPLDRPGAVDLTAHVNWDELIRAGEAEGLTTVGVVRQGRYLTEAGLFDLISSEAEKWRAFRLVDPEGMGEELSVLIQKRGP